ncbi:MAG: alkaline phosphatase family protein [Planctomycetota bacterium]|nr:alkaline phosphatase family protein [Planctomycetota bacterium]
MSFFESTFQLAYIGPGAGITFVGSFLILLASFGLLLLSILTWPFRFLIFWIKHRRLHLKPLASRVVVIGLDGLDPGRVRRLMSLGKMPNFQKLAETGTISDLATTLPPISPVAWSSFQTGVNPGKHNIYDFLNRDLRTYLPELSSVRITEGTMAGWRKWFGGGATVRLLRKNQPFWKILGEHGIFSTILRVPITFPPERFFGLSLSAMCIPDLRGTQGSFTLFTTDSGEAQVAAGGIRIHVRRSGNRIDAWLSGPPKPAGHTPPDYQTRLRIRIFEDRQQVEVQAGREKITLPLCRESEWMRVEFRVGRFTRVRGLCKLRLESLKPHFRLYVSPIHLDPERPAMPISHPLYFSMYLARLHNSFGTLGLAEDTWGLNSGVVAEDAFLEQAWAIHDERERMLFDSLRRMQRGLTVCVFDGPDRIQHMFWRHNVPEHPANRGRNTEQHRHVIDEMYVRMDDLAGRVSQELRDGDILFVLSDHGFCDFSRGVNLNVWLRENGYLTVTESVESGDYFAGVDWSRTKAYAFGLSGIYLNQQGREGKGIVPAAETAALRQEIVQKLSGLQDSRHSRRAVFRVHDCHKEYTGPYVANGPDVIVGYEKGYRASWENAVGRVDGPLFRDNDRPWSGDHCVDPALVPGVLLINRKLSGSVAPSILDFAPTILKLFGVPRPAYFDGSPWEFEETDTEQKTADSRQEVQIESAVVAPSKLKTEP